MLKPVQISSSDFSIQPDRKTLSFRFAKAAAQRSEIQDIYDFTKHFIGLSEGRTYFSEPDLGQPKEPIAIHPARVSTLLDRAEKTGLVQRDGMELSGFEFISREIHYLGRGQVPLKAIMPAIMQVHRESRRALNILDNTGGYTPRNHPLYGPAIQWTPLIP